MTPRLPLILLSLLLMAGGCASSSSTTGLPDDDTSEDSTEGDAPRDGSVFDINLDVPESGCVDSDRDGARVGDNCLDEEQDCDDEDGGVYPGALDRPDPDGRDSNCDGLDGDASRSVFLSINTGDDANSGRSVDAPVASLEAAFEVAAACEGSPCAILIAEGRYSLNETLVVPDGMKLYGGYADGIRGTAFERTGVTAAVTLEGVTSPAVHIDAVTEGVHLDTLTIAGGDAQEPGGESVALLVTDTPELGLVVIEGCSIRAGIGRSGADGEDGAVTECEAIGGAGGEATDCSSDPGDAGSAGGDPTSAGEGGPGGSSNCPNACPLVGGDGVSGGDPGKEGGNGVSASERPLASTLEQGSFSAEGDWLSSFGEDGGRGLHGGGGGGGGSGGSKRFRVCFGCGTLLGGSGGTGGQPGCGGGGGTGGQQGGASIGVVLVNARASFPATTISMGTAGNGGDGGRGADGGEGQEGEPGAARNSQRCGAITYDSGAGADGGPGGDGGGGAGGAGGNGGPAIGVAVVGDSSMDVEPASFSGGKAGSAGVGGGGGLQGGATSVAVEGALGRAGTLSTIVQFELPAP